MVYAVHNIISAIPVIIRKIGSLIKSEHEEDIPNKINLKLNSQ
jgi:hypothetical protein